jgi:copper(I)-binding protein
MKPALSALLLATGPAWACPGLDVQDPWIREAPPGAMMMAAYAKLANQGSHALSIDGARGDDFASVELHRTVVDKGMSLMKSGQALTLAPGAHAALEPGGWHLMLVEPKRALKGGDRVPLTLRCGARDSTFTFTVKAAK